MNTKISFTMKTFICTAAFILTTIFSFANGNSEINIHYPTSYSHQPKLKKVNDISVLTLSYDVNSFCEGKNGLSVPKINEPGGIFSYTRESNGIGGLAFNDVSGKIDHSGSDKGVYKITYKKGEVFATALITVNSCN